MNTMKSYLLRGFSKFLYHQSNLGKIRKIARDSCKQISINNGLHPYFPVDGKLSAQEVLFISGRFRSGSTLLWNIFRQIDRCTAYYEPFNERKWFSSSQRGDRVDSTHLGVTNYWEEYKGLEYLEQYYEESWIDTNLLMDASSFNHRMTSYIDALIKESKNYPVLQFNRADFRLQWLRHNFPACKIIHIYRHPREQWLSFLTDKALMDSSRVQQTYVDAFYLDPWCRDLEVHFPFLSVHVSPHPYTRFYYLWKLSFLYGQKYSDLSVCFESLVENPDNVLHDIFSLMGWPENNSEKVKAVIKKPRLDKWRDYASEGWFSEKEEECERVLDGFFGRSGE